MPEAVMETAVLSQSTMQRPLLSRKAISAAWLSTIAPQGVWMMPLIVGSFASRIPMSNSAAGLLATTALVGACIMALVQALFFRVLPPRLTTWLCLGALGIAYGGFALAPGYGLALALMGLMGIGLGGLLVVAMTTAVETGRQTEVIALGGIGQGALSALLAWLVSMGGENGALTLLPFLLLATCVSGLGAVSGVSKVPAVSAHVESRPGHDRQAKNHWPILLALGGWGLINFSNGGFWPLIERSAEADGLSIATISLGMSYTSIASIVAAVMALVLARRLGLTLPILISGLGTVVAIMGIVWSPTSNSFAAGMVLFGLLWSLGPAYQLVVVAEADHTGNSMAWSILVMKVSMAIGPVIYGVIADHMDYFAAGLVSSAAAVLSTALFVMSLMRSTKSSA